MDDLIGRLVAIAGVDRTAAEKAVGIARQWPSEEGRSRALRALAPLVPDDNSSLRSPSMGRIDAVTRETFSFARDTAREAAVGEIVDAIPGLGQSV